jgi:hypothetical protein
MVPVIPQSPAQQDIIFDLLFVIKNDNMHDIILYIYHRKYQYLTILFPIAVACQIEAIA